MSSLIDLSQRQIELIDKILKTLENDVVQGYSNASGYIYLTIGSAYEPYSTLDVSNYLTYIKEAGQYTMDNRLLLNGIRDWWIKQTMK